MRRTLDQNEVEDDEADQRHSTEPFKSPLHARFSELEERWSGIKQCSPMKRIDSSASVTSATASVRRANTGIPDVTSATRRSKSEQFTVSPVSTSPPYRDSNPSSSSSISQHSHQSKRSTSLSSSVFERLYSHGKAKVSVARKGDGVGTSWESKPKKRQSASFAVGLPSDASVDPSHRSGGGSTISTLSSTSSTRRSLPESRRAPQPVQRAPSKPISASTSVASLDRGIKHPRTAHDAVRRRSEYLSSNSSVPNLPSPMEHLLGQAIDENSISVSSSRSKDDVFHRLYRREKRPRNSLLASYRGPTTKPPSIQAPVHPNTPEQNVDTTPLRRGGESRLTHHEGNIDTVRTTSYDAPDENESFYSTNSDGRQSGSASDESLLVVRSCGDDANAIDVEDSVDRLTDNQASEKALLSECTLHTPRVFHDPLAFTPHMFADSPLAERAKTVRERHSAKKIQRAFRRNLVNASKVENHSNAATVIQTIWRMYLGERKLIDSMIVGWWMKCDFASTLDYNRVLIMKMGLESLRKVIRQVYGMEHVTALELESDRISIEWTREVPTEVDFQGAPVMEIVVVRLKCSARRLAFANHWSSDKTISRVVRAALSKTVKRDQRKFFHVCAVIIQVWARKVAARQQLRACGFLRQVEATNSVILATCLTPTSRERNAAIRIQCAWRCHRAQLSASSLLLTSWTSECELQHSSVCNAILQQRIRLLAVSKAIGQVDCWWLTEAIEIFADCISVSWQREVGIHYERQGSRQLESCVVQLTCQAARSSINATWDQRKMGIMLIKAALERVFERDQYSLRCSSVVMIQSWWRMIPRRRSFLMAAKVDREAMKLKQTQLSVHLQTLWRRYIQRNRYLALRASCITIQQMARKRNERSAQTRAATLIQNLWRKSTVQISYHDSSNSLLHLTLQSCQSRQTSLAAQRGLERCQALARGRRERIQCLRKKNGITTIQRFWRTSAAVRTLRRKKAAVVIIQALARCSRQVIVFRRMQANAVKIQALVRAHLVQKAFLSLKANIVMLQSQVRRLLAQSQLRYRRSAALAIKDAWHQYNERRQLQHGQQLVVLQACAVMIQAHFRARLRTSAFIQQKKSAALAQRIWRGSLARRRVRTEMEATRRIQTAWRHHREQQCLRRVQQHQALDALATRIQAHCRAHIRRSAFIQQKKSAALAQRIWRGSLVRRRLRTEMVATRRIQTAWRRHREQQCLRRVQQHQALDALATRIQAHCRAHVRRSAFIQQKKSAALAQRIWRGSLVRRRLRTEMEATRRIQTAWHRHREQQCLRRVQQHKALDALATRIQAHCRANIRRSAFIQQKQSAALAQRVWRGSLARRRWRVTIAAVRRIQTSWHRHHAKLQRAKEHAEKAALVTLIQAQVRAHLARSAFLQQKGSAVIAQRVWRGNQARSRLRVTIAAVRAIQSVWRRHREHQCSQRAQQHLALEVHATRIQAQVRAHLRRSAFLQQKGSAVIAQRVWRGSQARSRLRVTIAAVRRIQTVWHRHHAKLLRAKEHAAKAALATLIQAQVRARVARNAFLQQKGSAVKAQRVWRGSHARSRLRVAIAAVRRIQTVWYRHHANLQRVKEHAATAAVVTLIQAQVRARVARNAFLQQKGSAVIAQRVWRGSHARSRLRVTIAAVRTIQSVWRRHREKECLRRLQQHKALDALATRIQAHFRAHIRRSAFIQQKQSAALAQRVWRGSLARRRWRVTIAAVRRIQTVWHRHHAKLQRAKEHAEKAALVTLIQAQVRARVARNAFLQQKGSTVIAQRVWRGSQARSRLRVTIAAVRAIQSVWRRHREHQCSQRAQQHLALEVHATRIQAQVRAHLRRSAFLQQKGSAVIAQRVWRGSLARGRWRVTIAAVRRIQTVWHRHHAKLQRAKEHAAKAALATLIQAQVRARIARNEFLQQKGSAVIAQRVWRGSHARSRLRVAIAAVRRIQTVWHRHHAKLQRAKEHAAKAALATLFQAQVRARVARNAFLQQKGSAVIAQRVWRGNQARSRLRVTIAAVRRIQTVWHRHHAKLQRAKEHAETAALATLIQAHVRAHLQRSVFLQQKGSAVLAQRIWRSILARRENELLSAIAIQRNWRRYRCESHYFAILMGVLAIQSWFRQILWTLRLVRGVLRLQAVARGARSRSTFLRMRKSADMIKRSWRCHCANMLQRRAYFATRIQAVARSRISRMNVTRYRSMVIRVQAFLRRFLVKIAIARLTSEATSIQCFWRSRVARSRFLEVRWSAAVLQKWVRMAMARKVYVEVRSAALVIQCYWRRLGYKRSREVVLRNAVFVQKTTRCHLARQRYLKAKRGICLVQALVRGSLQRFLVKDCRASLNAAVSIQSIARRKFERDNFVNLRDAAIRIQKHQRMRKVRLLRTVKRRRQHLALASFQAIVRAKLAGSLFAQQKRAARVIQAAFFAWKMNLTLLEVQSSVVLLKRSIRGQLERSATRFALSHVNDSRRSFERMSNTSFRFDTSTLLAWSEAESMAKECAAVVIQGSIRRFIAIVRTREMVEESLSPKSETKIGSRWRVILLRQDENATIIQARFRAFQKRQELKNYSSAATLLQASYRSHRHARNFFRTKTCIIKMQYLFRMRQSKTISAAHNIAAILIQASVRGFQSRTQYRLAVESVRIIQSFWRQCVDSTRKRKELVSAVRIQKWTKAMKRRVMERRELALATEREIHFVEKAILLEMERNARDQVGLLLLKTRRVRPTSACVRRLAKRVKSLSENCKENHTRGKSNNAGLFAVYEQGDYTNTPI
ncbi:hypothetical protein MHU86_3259 [Fragilaria crotonensis]|nr:hypothetical protein MHU86_3259 [Fragilaria crotonensis]